MDSDKGFVKKEEPYDAGYQVPSDNFAMDANDQKDVKVEIEEEKFKSKSFNFTIPDPVDNTVTWTEQEAYLALKAEAKSGFSKEVVSVTFPDPVITPEFIKSINPKIKSVTPFPNLAPRSCNVFLKDQKKSSEVLNDIRASRPDVDAKKRFLRSNNKYIDTSTVNPLMLKVFDIKDMFEMPHIESAFDPGNIILTKKSRKRKIVAIVSFKNVYEAIFALDNLVENKFMVNEHKIKACFMRYSEKIEYSNVIKMGYLKIEFEPDVNAPSTSGNVPIKDEDLVVKKEEPIE